MANAEIYQRQFIFCFCVVGSNQADSWVESSRIVSTERNSSHILVVDDDPAVQHLISEYFVAARLTNRPLQSQINLLLKFQLQ